MDEFFTVRLFEIPLQLKVADSGVARDVFGSRFGVVREVVAGWRMTFGWKTETAPHAVFFTGPGTLSTKRMVSGCLS